MLEVLSIFATTEAWLALLTLTVLEVVLGIDNIVVIAILTEDLPEKQRPRMRKIGLAGALITRLMLLFALSWIMSLDKAILFTVAEHTFTAKDLVLVVGGAFLVGKASHEIFESLESVSVPQNVGRAVAASAMWVVVQIMLMDAVFSVDSVITAVGMVPAFDGVMAKRLFVMATAVILAIIAMMVFADPISNFIGRHPSMKILALSFLILIGVLLVAEGLGQHVNKGYIYFAMAFSFGVEMVNLRLRKGRRRPVKLHERYPAGTAAEVVNKEQVGECDERVANS